MSIHYTLRTEADLLEVVASGFDGSLSEVIAYGSAVVEAAIRTQARRILCNELDLTYTLGTLDIYESAKSIASAAPQIAHIAIVCRPAFAADIQFWENTVVNRGLTLKTFHDLDQARAWLDQHNASNPNSGKP